MTTLSFISGIIFLMKRWFYRRNALIVHNTFLTFMSECYVKLVMGGQTRMKAPANPKVYWLKSTPCWEHFALKSSLQKKG